MKLDSQYGVRETKVKMHTKRGSSCLKGRYFTLLSHTCSTSSQGSRYSHSQEISTKSSQKSCEGGHQVGYYYNYRRSQRQRDLQRCTQTEGKRMMLKRGGNIFKRGLDRLGEYTLGELEKTYQGTVNKENMDKALKAGFNMIKNKVMKRGSSVSQKGWFKRLLKKSPDWLHK